MALGKPLELLLASGSRLAPGAFSEAASRRIHVLLPSYRPLKATLIK